MLSPTVNVLPPEGSLPPEQNTRRRGLSYLRSLSSHSSAPNSEQLRASPRHFFQRSTSYNSDTKPKAATGRRRSASRPNEPTSPASERPTLTRVLSAGNSPVPSPIATPVPLQPKDNSSGEDTRPTRTQARAESTTEIVNTGTAGTDTLAAASERMARTSRPSTPRRTTDSLLPSAMDVTTTQALNGTRPASNSVSNGVSANNVTKNGGDEEKAKPPMIRFFPHQDLRNNGRQSLNFSPISRTLPSENSIIRVGRYSEREGLPVANPTHPSDAPVGFKSKVVSRKHCEFSFVDGQWQIRDVASSSGTFLNHIRLSQPNQESRLFPIKDGDIVQLGIDFRGGEEMIFRCVKIRIECNRSWQKKPNTFNKTRQAHLLGLTKDQPSAGQNSGECSICLGSVLPCQSLFVAPCAHVWHYKCIRPMIEGKQSQYPSFQCPNCRAWTDLEADVDMAEEDMDAWMENGGDTDDHLDVDQADRPQSIAAESGSAEESFATNPEPTTTSQEATTTALPVTKAAAAAAAAASVPNGGRLSTRRAVAFTGTTDGGSAVNSIAMPVRPNQEEFTQQLSQQQTSTETPNGEQIVAGEGPLTPRNNAGPFVFDGSGQTGETRRRTLFVPGLFEVTENRQS